MNTQHKQLAGFTLIELMVAVAVVGILAAVAYPSYQEYLRKTRRVDAKIALMSAAQALERYYTENMSYADADDDNVLAATSNDGHYSLSFASNSLTANTFTIKATPVNAGPQDGDKCGTFTLNNLGQKGVENATLSTSQCWD